VKKINELRNSQVATEEDAAQWMKKHHPSDPLPPALAARKQQLMQPHDANLDKVLATLKMNHK